MLLMFEKGNRGGLTQAVHQYVRASNKYMGETEGERAMIQKLTAGGFKWIDDDDVSKFTSEKIGRPAKDDNNCYL